MDFWLPFQPRCGFPSRRHVDARAVAVDANLDQEAVFPCFEQPVCFCGGVPFVDSVLPVEMLHDSPPLDPFNSIGAGAPRVEGRLTMGTTDR